MSILLGIDGGNRALNDRACYIAEFHAGILAELHSLNRAAAVKALRGGLTCDAVAVERPAYDGRIARGVPPSSVIDLAWNAAAVAFTLAAGSPVHAYTPTEWIGTVPKPVLHRRIWSALTGPERRAFPAATDEWLTGAAEHFARKHKLLQHPAFNTLDAAGVGLFHLGRIAKGGAKP